MYKEIVLQVLFNGITLIVVVAATIMTAGFLGPSSFGQYAATQSIALMLIPLATLRIETRIATCTSDKELSQILSATITNASLFIVIGLILTPILSVFFPWTVILSVILLTASSAIIEAFISGYSYKGQIKEVIKYRSIKQILPAGIVFISSYLFKDFQLAITALTISFLICMIILWLPMRYTFDLSFKALRNILREHSIGLRASFLLGSLNAVWSNSLLPLMNAMGLASIAGQYAIAQRLMNTPLGVIGISIQSMLLKNGNQLHENSKNILYKAFLFLLIAILLSNIIYYMIYVQIAIPFPEKWRLEKPLFYSANFFLACSFAVGTVSILGIRLKDEWFLAYWQIALISSWVIILLFFHSSSAFIYMLSIGGIGYWILLFRWLILSKKKYG